MDFDKYLKTIEDNPNINPYGIDTIWEGLGYFDYLFLPHYQLNHKETKLIDNCAKRGENMKKVYLVHCWEGTSNDGWYPWIEEELKKFDVQVVRFDMPNTDSPQIEEWVNTLDHQVTELNNNIYFIGHSIGCQTIMRYLETKEIRHLDLYKEALKLENILLPNKALRIRGLENHDQKRIYEYTHDFTIMKNLVAYQVFMKGPMFIYNGLETKADHLENLFSKDTMNLDIDESWFNFIKLLIKFKKEKFNQKLLTSNLLDTTNETLTFKNNYEDGSIAYGIFSLTGKEETITYKDLIDGTYIDYLTNKEYIIKNNSISTKEPLFLFKK